MSIGCIIRSALSLASLVIVGWAFFNVADRAIERHNAQHDRPITLTILHWGNPAGDKIDRELVDSFEKENPRVRIVRINVGDYGLFHEKLKTMMASGQPPDAFYLPQDILPTMARLKLIRPLDSYIAHEDKAWLDDFFPILHNGFKFDTATGAFGTGPTWALPKDFTTAGVSLKFVQRPVRVERRAFAHGRRHRLHGAVRAAVLRYPEVFCAEHRNDGVEGLSHV